MAFIDRIGEIASKVVAKTLSDPEKSGELLRLGLTAATLPDREDTSQSAFDLGRFRQYNISRQQEDQAKAAALEAQRKAAEEQRKRIFEIEKEDRKLRFDADMRVAEHIAERQKENRERFDKFLTEFDNFRADAENRHWSMYANKVGNKYVPNERTLDAFRFHKMFGQGRNSLEDEAKGGRAFDKLIRAAAERYKLNTKKRELESQQKLSQKDQVSVLPGVTTFGENMGIPVNFFHVPYNSYSKEQKIGPNGEVLRSTQDNMIDAHHSVAINGMTNFARSFFTDKNFQKASELGFTQGEYAGILDAYKNLDYLMLNPEKNTEKNDSPKVIANGIAKLLVGLGEADAFRKALVRVKNGRNTDGANNAESSRVKGSGNISYKYDLNFYRNNPIMTQVALKLGALSNFELQAIEAERLNAGGERNTKTVTETPEGDTNVVYGFEHNSDKISQALADQDRNMRYLLKRATDDQKDEFKAIDEEIQKKYAEAGDEEREDLFFRRQALIQRIQGGSRSQKNEYLAAALYLAAGRPTSKTIRNGLNFSIYHMDNPGIALKDKNNNATKLLLNLQSNLNNVNDLLRSFQRIRTLAEVSEADFNRFGGLDFNVQTVKRTEKPPIAGYAGELAGRFESAVKFFHEAFAAIRGEGVAQFKGGSLAGNLEIGTRLQEFKLDPEAFEKKYGYRIDLDPDNMGRVTGIKDQMIDGFNQIDLDYAEAMKSGTLKQQEQAKRLYLRRTAMMWEKAALTYKLAGYVQGEQTGGRTISNQDFDNIYKALWGGNFSSEESAINAVRYLNFTTKEIRDRNLGEIFLLQTTGKGFSLDLAANNYAERLYQQRLDRFFKNNPQVEKFLKNNSVELERSDTTVRATEMAKIAQYAQSNNMGGTINFTLANLEREGIARLTKNTQSLYRVMGRKNKISQSKFPLAYNDFEEMYKAVLGQSGKLSDSVSSLVFNYDELEKAMNEKTNNGKPTERAEKAAMIVTRISDKLPRISQTNTVLENIGTILEIFKDPKRPFEYLGDGSNQGIDKLESEFVSKVGSTNLSILKFFRDDPSFLEYILRTYHGDEG
tara:strand:+ start:4797 stop:7985 length:3189 start_codon:yes stop_codon:yes gene_type:complete